jgi:hypothetical protein
MLMGRQIHKFRTINPFSGNLKFNLYAVLGGCKKNNSFYILEQMKIEIEYEGSTYSQWTLLHTVLDF